VTDIGTRTVIAIRIDEVRVAGGKDGGIVAILDQAEAEAQGWFKGPPYMVAEEVFDEYSFGGCSPVPK
jgi:hypothetical protein